MAEAKQAWTDAEKVILNHGLEQQLLIQKDGLFFQIIEKTGPIPWDDLSLPEGRTRKACLVMVDREKQKVKKAREAAGEVVESTPKTTPKTKSKPKADGETETPARSAKKVKGRKKARDEDNNNGGVRDEEVVKADEGEIKTEAEEEGLS